jgi:MFS family permease
LSEGLADPGANPGVFAHGRGRLSLGLVLTIVVVAFEGLAVATIMPITALALRGLALYAWSFSGFMLGGLVGTVVVSEYAERHGPAFPFKGALAVFSCGLLLCGMARTMPVFIAGRMIEGLGTGAVRSLIWLILNRAYPAKTQARMGAVLSSALILPSLVGPALAGIIAQVWSWRVVFLALLPLVPCALWLILQPLSRIVTQPMQEAASRRTRSAMQLAAGVGLFLFGLERSSLVSIAGFVLMGVALAWPALHRILPAGTLRLSRGLPAVLGTRGLLTFAFFAALAFFPLALELERGLTATIAGIGLSVGSVGWTSGSWLQAYLDYRFGPEVRPRIMLGGLLLLAIGIAGASSVLLPNLPISVGVAFWGVAGLGMGVCFNTDTVLAIQSASEYSAGIVSSSMQLSDSLGQTLGTGFGGGTMALARWMGWGRSSGIGITFVLSMAICLMAMLTSPRLLSTVQDS